ncbi:hypothetical protein [Salsuginibacillus kocurii]|uniref:hypothetical protein n=1 Tax=Salsuginibacillus kocurii TaxID=427078 RepID=UPI00036A5493|nr:hypothetical protein [Salsuginibacillus kocurii]
MTMTALDARQLLNLDYCFSDEKVKQTAYRLPVRELFTAAGAASFLEAYTAQIGKTSEDLDAAAMFWAVRSSKWFTYLHWCQTSGQQVDPNEWIVVLLPNQHPKKEPVLTYIYTPQPAQAEVVSSVVDTTLASLYVTVISPLLQQIAAQAHVKSEQLWGQLDIGISNGFKTFRDDEALESRLQREWKHIKETAPAFTFLEVESPFPFALQSIPAKKGEGMTTTKPSCCLAYKTIHDSQCYRCPKLSKQEREKKRISPASVQ